MNIGKKSLVQALSVLQIIKLILVNLVSRILKKKVALFFSDLSLTKINHFIPLNKWIGHFQRANEIIEKNLFFGSGFRNYRIICFDYQKK